MARRSSPRTPGAAVAGAAVNAVQNPPPPKQVAASLAGFVLGVLLDVLFINYMRGGWAQVKAWLAAKFLNEPNASYGA